MRKLAAAGLAAALGIVLAGCGSGGSGSGSDKSTVTLWMYPVIGDQAKSQAFWAKVEKDFEAKNTSVDLKIDMQPWEGRQEKVTTALAAKKGFDLVVLGPDQIPQYAQQGTLEPVDDIIAAEKASYLPNSLAALTVDGKLYGVPVYQTITAPIYNKKLFADAGVTEIPDTLAELKEAAPKLAANKVAVLDYPGKPEVSLNQSFYPIFWANGGSIFAADGKTVAFNGPEGVESLQFLLDLKAAGGLPENTASKGNDIEGGALAGGQSAMYHAATALQAVQLGKVIGDENVGIGLPLEGKKRVAFGIPGGLVMAKHSENKEAAKKFAAYLSSPAVAADLAKESGFFSARTDVTIPGQTPAAAEFAKSLEFAFPGDTHPKARQVMGIIAAHLQAALLGKEDAKAALDGAAQEANTLLASGG
ncbi:ABC transporter substrate-binding protein [Nonomuraea sp. NPDC050663]|uniref:ABC transporter substrate-binding protein n=1 Tax=Nonomuraea sp. NPDC050663 TaxID=3364370 RepID=UPI0037A88CB2